MNTQNKLTRAIFSKILASYIAKEQEYINEHEAIKAILLPLEGKPIDGRTLNKKTLGSFELSPQYGMYYIKGKFDHLIGYQNSSENTIQVNPTKGHRGFIELDARHGRAAQERIELIKNTDKEKAFKLFSEIQKHFEALRRLFGQIEAEQLGSFHFPAYYEILNYIYKEKQSGDLKLTDFYFIRK